MQARQLGEIDAVAIEPEPPDRQRHQEAGDDDAPAEIARGGFVGCCGGGLLTRGCYMDARPAGIVNCFVSARSMLCRIVEYDRERRHPDGGRRDRQQDLGGGIRAFDAVLPGFEFSRRPV